MKAPDYEKERLDQIRAAVEKSDVSNARIISFCENTKFDEKEVREKIENDVMFRWIFAKDPIRGNLYETIFLNCVRDELSFLKNIKKPPSLMLHEGKITDKKYRKKHKINPPCKSIDIYWECKEYKFYVYHKYAKEAGGHQDNQYQDVICFIKEANKSTEPKNRFLAVTDGAFWNTTNGKVGTTKLENLKNIANNKSVFALTSDELEDLLVKLGCA